MTTASATMLRIPRAFLFLSGVIFLLIGLGVWKGDQVDWQKHVVQYAPAWWSAHAHPPAPAAGGKHPHHFAGPAIPVTPENGTNDTPAEAQHSVTIVVASQREDDTAWVRDGFPAWQKRIYVTDDAWADYTVPKNRGREGMVYLTYIIDHYDSLSDVTVFSHAGRYQWHNDDPLYDGQRLLEHLRPQHVVDAGYANLRCAWVLGCPVGVSPLEGLDVYHDKDAEHAEFGWWYKEAFETLFPGQAVPEEIGAACCAQFAVSGATIRMRPRSDYERYRQWLLDTDLPDDLSGRILEYAWHIMFQQSAIHCPNAQDCYCRTYGLCNLTCEDDGECSSQYKLPEVSTLPDGWPEVGWDGESVDVARLRLEQDQAYAARED